MRQEFPAFHGFDWDDGNRDKNLKHGVRHGECEQVFFNAPLFVSDDPRHSTAEARFAAFGQTDDGRRLTLVFTMRGSNVRVISAHDMSRKERQFYENASKEV